MSKKIDVVMAFVAGLIVALCCSSCGSSSPDDTYKTALHSLDSRNYKRAQMQLSHAVEESSKEQALNLVSQIKEDSHRYFEKKDYQAECCLFSAAIDAARKGWGDSADDSNLGPLYEKLLTAQINNGQYQLAEETLNKSLREKSGNLPESPDKNQSSNLTALARRVARAGEYLERKDQHEQAQHLYNQALKMLVDNQQDKDYWLLARIHADLGTSLKASGQSDGAGPELQSARDFASKAPEPIANDKAGNADKSHASKLLGLESADNQTEESDANADNNNQQTSTSSSDNPKADAKKWQSSMDQAVTLIGQNQLSDAQTALYDAMQVYPDNEAYMKGCELYVKLYVLEKKPQLGDSCAVDAMNRAQRLGQNDWSDKMSKWHQTFQSMLGDAGGQPDSNAGAPVVHRSLSQQLQDLKFYKLPHTHSMAGFEKLADQSTSQPQPNSQQWQDLIDKANNLIDRKQFDAAEQTLTDAMHVCPDNESNNKTMVAFIKLYELRGDTGTADAYATDALKAAEKNGNSQWAQTFRNAHQRLQH